MYTSIKIIIVIFPYLVSSAKFDPTSQYTRTSQYTKTRQNNPKIRYEYNPKEQGSIQISCLTKSEKLINVTIADMTDPYMYAITYQTDKNEFIISGMCNDDNGIRNKCKLNIQNINQTKRQIDLDTYQFISFEIFEPSDMVIVHWGCYAVYDNIHSTDNVYIMNELINLYDYLKFDDTFMKRYQINAYKRKPRLRMTASYIGHDDSYVALNCMINTDDVDLIAAEIIMDKRKVSLIRKVDIHGPNDFLISSDRRGKRNGHDSSYTCSLYKDNNMREGKNYTDISKSRSVIFPNVIIPDCYDYTGSRLCGIMPIFTVFATSQLKTKDTLYIPPKNNAILSDNVENGWLLPDNLLSSSYDIFKINDDIFAEVFQGYNYPTIPYVNSLLEDSEVKRMRFAPDVLITFLESFINLTSKYKSITLIKPTKYTVENSGRAYYDCSSYLGEKEKGSSKSGYVLLTLVKNKYIQTLNQDHIIGFKEPYPCGPNKELQVTAITDNPLTLNIPLQNDDIVIVNSAWCFMGKYSDDDEGSGYVGETQLNSEKYHRSHTFSIKLSTYTEMEKVKENELLYNNSNTDQCNEDVFDNINTTVGDALNYIHEKLFARYKSQRNYITYNYPNWKRQTIHHNTPGSPINCRCGQQINSCDKDKLLAFEYATIGTGYIPLSHNKR